VERVQQKIVYAGGDSNTEKKKKKKKKQVPPLGGDNDNYLRKRRGQANIHPPQKVVLFCHLLKSPKTMVPPPTFFIPLESGHSD
jgi:hypothetical protein